MTKANSKTDRKKAEHARKQRQKEQEDIEYWAIKLINFRTNKKDTKLSHKQTYGSFHDDMGFRVAVDTSSHLSWPKVKQKAYRMSKKIEADKNAKNNIPIEVVLNKLAGRPTGSTNAASLKMNKRKEDALSLLTEKVKQARMKNGGDRVPKVAYKVMHDEVLEQFDLLHGGGFTIKYGTIKARIGRGTTKSRPGPTSPSLAIEPYLVTFALY